MIEEKEIKYCSYVGMEVRFTEESIITDRPNVNPADFITTAINWLKYAKEHDWKLLTSNGHEIDRDNFLKEIDKTIGDLR